jgi:hypothetical protein
VTVKKHFNSKKTFAAFVVVLALCVSAFAAGKSLGYGGASITLTSAGNVTISQKSGGTITIGLTGTGLTRIAKYSAALTPSAVPANTCAEQLFTVTGIATGDVVAVNKPTAQAGLGVAGVRASATNQVGVNFCNATASPITPTAAETYLFTAIR